MFWEYLFCHRFFIWSFAYEQYKVKFTPPPPPPSQLAHFWVSWITVKSGKLVSYSILRYNLFKEVWSMNYLVWFLSSKWVIFAQLLLLSQLTQCYSQTFLSAFVFLEQLYAIDWVRKISAMINMGWSSSPNGLLPGQVTNPYLQKNLSATLFHVTVFTLDHF